MNESRAVVAGALVGAFVGGAAAYLFFTESGKQARDRLEPAVDNLRREFARFQKTIETLGEVADSGIRAVNEFNAARAESSFDSSRTSH